MHASPAVEQKSNAGRRRFLSLASIVGATLLIAFSSNSVEVASQAHDIAKRERKGKEIRLSNFQT
ncbi:hypothetical protein BOTCAL_0380g00070 [Botryotinia calthae]|uniref:Uncharacterized protein n=1 Tax=Botryotinia calthae TaxID=38488 RepID=A0A4Y8CRF5_9HELO|nr:hypothetical protein BOTCAL_0380g00070 [Botryotinia calthae]